MRLTKPKSGQAAVELTERAKFIVDHLTFLEAHRGKSRSRKSSKVSTNDYHKEITK
jgi:hypothetical protein